MTRWPLAHADTNGKFANLPAWHLRRAAGVRRQPIVFRHPDARSRGIDPLEPGLQFEPDLRQSQDLEPALDAALTHLRSPGPADRHDQAASMESKKQEGWNDAPP